MRKFASILGSLFLAISLCPINVLADSDKQNDSAQLQQKQQIILALQNQIEHWRSLTADEMREELRVEVQAKLDEYQQSGVESEELEMELADAFTVLENFDDDTRELYIAGLEAMLQAFSSSAVVNVLPYILWPCTMGIVVNNWQTVEKDDSNVKTAAKYAANTGLSALLVATVPADIVWDILLLGTSAGVAVCSGISHTVSKK